MINWRRGGDFSIKLLVNFMKFYDGVVEKLGLFYGLVVSFYVDYECSCFVVWLVW